MRSQSCPYCNSALPVGSFECHKCGASITAIKGTESQFQLKITAQSMPKNLVWSLSILVICVGLTVVLLSSAQFLSSKSGPGTSTDSQPRTQAEIAMLAQNKAVKIKQPDSDTNIQPQTRQEIRMAAQSTMLAMRNTAPAFEVAGIPAEYRKYYLRSAFSNAMADLSYYRTKMIQYHDFKGDFPKDTRQFLDKTGIKGFDTGKYTRSISVVDGALVAGLAAPFAEGDYLSWKPVLSKYKTRIDWNCRTNLDESIVGPLMGMAAICQTVK